MRIISIDCAIESIAMFFFLRVSLPCFTTHTMQVLIDCIKEIQKIHVENNFRSWIDEQKYYIYVTLIVYTMTILENKFCENINFFFKCLVVNYFTFYKLANKLKKDS